MRRILICARAANTFSTGRTVGRGGSEEWTGNEMSPVGCIPPDGGPGDTARRGAAEARRTCAGGDDRAGRTRLAIAWSRRERRPSVFVSGVSAGRDGPC